MADSKRTQLTAKGNPEESFRARLNLLLDLEDDPLGLPRGIIWSVTVAAVFWAIIIWAFIGRL